jgi:CRISPR-associated endonuclease/helicase Cas3
MQTDTRNKIDSPAGSAFPKLFFDLTGHAPFAWQTRLYELFVRGQFFDSCALPTGLGKTSVIPIWLLALVAAPEKMPRRLVYVVNRRTVVDQATREAENIRERLAKVPAVSGALKALCAAETEAVLAISTLRGQFADNAEWRSDPARPAIIIGTVDMLGSRLLFNGYGCGFKSRPLHAGFLGQDALLVHDEAHLEPAFQTLIEAICSEQKSAKDAKPFRVMALSATTRKRGEPFEPQDKTFELEDNEKEETLVKKRLQAKKRLCLHSANDVPAKAAELALTRKDGGQAILVYLRTVKDVQSVKKSLANQDQQAQVLTGTLRGLERDELATRDPIFARFMPEADRATGVVPAAGTVFLICTSAGEVGVNISADHLICDLTPFDSMAQRFGRVNRFGDGDARIDVVHEDKRSEKKADDIFDQRRWLTLDLLQSLRLDASPAALGGLCEKARLAAFTPKPAIPPVSEILFDAWALTSIREPLPGRPPVADWLHGIRAWEPPETHVAWREEVEVIAGDLLQTHRPEDLLEDYPLKPHELLRDSSDRVFEVLKKLAESRPDKPVWVLNADDSVRTTTLENLAKDKEDIYNRTVLLPPSAGGIKAGMLDSGSDVADDIADQWLDENKSPRRQRVWDDDTPPKGMRLIRRIPLRSLDEDDEGESDTENEGESAPRHFAWSWYARPRDADDDGSKSAREPQALSTHLDDAAGHAGRLAKALRLPDAEAQAVVFAARFHDLGKRRDIWQKSIGNHEYPEVVLAKSGGKMRPVELSRYRHEFGSLMEAPDRSEFQVLPPEARELALHLIAAHHGRARPHFTSEEAFDPDAPDDKAVVQAVETPRRYARLQRQHGRWGLAYLESLVRAADILASGGGQ